MEAESRDSRSKGNDYSQEKEVTINKDDLKVHENPKEMVRKILGARVICTLTDGRKVTGRLVCVDRLKNLILADCLEERLIHSRDYNPDKSVPNQSKIAQRPLAQAMLPGHQLVKVEIERSVWLSRVCLTETEAETPFIKST